MSFESEKKYAYERKIGDSLLCAIGGFGLIVHICKGLTTKQMIGFNGVFLIVVFIIHCIYGLYGLSTRITGHRYIY